MTGAGNMAFKAVGNETHIGQVPTSTNDSGPAHMKSGNVSADKVAVTPTEALAGAAIPTGELAGGKNGTALHIDDVKAHKYDTKRSDGMSLDSNETGSMKSLTRPPKALVFDYGTGEISIEDGAMVNAKARDAATNSKNNAGAPDTGAAVDGTKPSVSHALADDQGHEDKKKKRKLNWAGGCGVSAAIYHIGNEIFDFNDKIQNWFNNNFDFDFDF